MKTKKILFQIFFLLLNLNAFCQFSAREKEAAAFEQNQDSLPRSIFLDSKDLPQLELGFAGNSRQVWSSTDKTAKDIEQFFDIRIQFESKEKALAFHKEYLKENSEFGPEIKKHKVNTTGTEDFKAFKAAELMNQMIEPYGLQMYCYLFVVDHYFVKLFVTCKKELEPAMIQPYVNSIVKKINN